MSIYQIKKNVHFEYFNGRSRWNGHVKIKCLSVSNVSFCQYDSQAKGKNGPTF